MNEFSRKIYISPRLPAVLLAVGGLLLRLSISQLGMLGMVPVFLMPDSSASYKEDTIILRPYAEIISPESILACLDYRCER